MDNVLRLEVLTCDGCRMWVGPTTDEEDDRILAEGGRRAGTHRELRALRDDDALAVRRSSPTPTVPTPTGLDLKEADVDAYRTG